MRQVTDPVFEWSFRPEHEDGAVLGPRAGRRVVVERVRIEILDYLVRIEHDVVVGIAVSGHASPSVILIRYTLASTRDPHERDEGNLDAATLWLEAYRLESLIRG